MKKPGINCDAHWAQLVYIKKNNTIHHYRFPIRTRLCNADIHSWWNGLKTQLRPGRSISPWSSKRYSQKIHKEMLKTTCAQKAKRSIWMHHCRMCLFFHNGICFFTFRWFYNSYFLMMSIWSGEKFSLVCHIIHAWPLLNHLFCLNCCFISW